jgi:hypothetical protein
MLGSDGEQASSLGRTRAHERPGIGPLAWVPTPLDS